MSENGRLNGNSLRMLDACKEIFAEYTPLGVRAVCYKLLVAGRIPAMTHNETKKISDLLVKAREQELLPWDWIIDESRKIEAPPVWDNLAEYGPSILASYRRDFWASQPYHIQLWSEKATVGGVLSETLEAYRVPFLVLHGFGSATVVKKTAQASAMDPRECVILYVGDWDPSGMWMSEKDIPKRMARYEGRFSVRRIALIEEDVPGLPPNPEKEKEAGKKEDTRLPWYRENYGTEQWELDAMDPPTLRQRVENAICEYIDVDAWRRAQAQEQADKQRLGRLIAKMK